MWYYLIRKWGIQMSKEIETTEENKSLAMQLMEILKTQTKRWFICWLITFAALTCLVIYTIYELNDLAIVETTEITQDAETGTNNYIGNDGEIAYGQTNDKES